MRLEGQAKAGFYPTPLPVARLIGSCLVSDGRPYLLDPCCGPGEALETVNLTMQSRGRAITHGVELEQARAAEAEETLEVVLQGDSLKVKASGGYGALYLNPPYDQADGKRLELTGRRIFLWLSMTLLFWFFCVALSPLFVYIGPLGFFLTGVLGLSWGVGVAAYADRRLTRQALFGRRYLSAYGQYLRRSLPSAIMRNWFVFIVGFVGTMIGALLPRSTEVGQWPALPTNPSAVVLLVVFFMSASALLLQNLLANSHGSTHIHRLLLTVLLGLTWDESGVLVSRGYTLNRTQLGKLSGVRLTMGLFSVVVLSIFVPLIGTLIAAFGLVLFPFASSLFYVSFRDIYLGVAENIPVRSEKRVVVSVPD